MTDNSKSMILLAVTLVVGFALGLFADASLVRRRFGAIDGIRRPPGFVDHMVSVIQPHSDAQRDSIKPALQHIAEVNQQAFRDADKRMRASIDSMQTALAPILDAGQRDRLAAEINRGPGFGRGRGGRGGGPGHGPGGFGRGGSPSDRRTPPHD
jgi:hypothetical protein